MDGLSISYISPKEILSLFSIKQINGNINQMLKLVSTWPELCLNKQILDSISAALGAEFLISTCQRKICIFLV